MNPMNLNVNLYKRINWLKYNVQTISIDEAIDIIRAGSYLIDDSKQSGWVGRLSTITEAIQKLPIGTNLQPIKAQFLPAVSFNGVFLDGKILQQYSNITAMDFDHIPSQEAYNELYYKLAETPCVRNIFRTPSGRGLKALVMHDNLDPDKHGNLYTQLLAMFATPYVKTDSSCRDLTRRNYLCYDPFVWTNPNPIPFHYVYNAAFDAVLQTDKDKQSDQTTKAPVQRVKPSNVDTSISDKSIMYILRSICRNKHKEFFQEGHRRYGVYWFGNVTGKAGVDYDYGLDFVKELYQSNEVEGDFPESEIVDNYSKGYDNEPYDECYRQSFKK